MSPEREAEVAALAQRYGEPRRVHIELHGKPFSPISATNRVGEVCMVVRRTNGTLITAIKTFYPPGAFRLLTGGIEHGEAIEDALLRETKEETNLDVVVRRFLAVIEYTLGGQGSGVGEQEENARASTTFESQSLVPDPRSLTPDPSYQFVTFAFLLDETGGTLQSMDPHEQLDEFREFAVDELPTLAHTLEHIGGGFDSEIEGKWGDWGRFRAVVHRVVYETLTSDE